MGHRSNSWLHTSVKPPKSPNIFEPQQTLGHNHPSGEPVPMPSNTLSEKHFPITLSKRP